MFTFFSIIVILSSIVIIISAILWAISAARKKPVKIKRVLAVSFVLFSSSFIGCALTAPPVDKSTLENQSPVMQDIAVEPSQEPVLDPEASIQEDIPAKPQELAEAPQEPAQAVEPENPLAELVVQEHPVMNGFKTERIGTWTSIATTKEFFSSATDEQIFQYLNEVAENNYNWINVFFGDGTGLWCMSSMGGYYIEYGAVDEDEGGAVIHESDVATRYFRYENGTYVENTE